MFLGTPQVPVPNQTATSELRGSFLGGSSGSTWVVSQWMAPRPGGRPRPSWDPLVLFFSLGTRCPRSREGLGQGGVRLDPGSLLPRRPCLPYCLQASLSYMVALLLRPTGGVRGGVSGVRVG